MISRSRPLVIFALVLTLAVGIFSFVDTRAVSAAPTNDNFANAITINPAALPYTLTLDNTGATDEVNERLSLCSSTVTGSLWWNFTPTVSGNYQIDTLGSAVPADDTVLDVFTGNSVSGLSYFWCNDDTNTGGRNSKLIQPLTAGTTYRIRVAEFGGTLHAGMVTLNVQRIIIAPSGVTISANPNTTPLEGQSVTLTANTTAGTAPFTYSWYRGTAGDTTNPTGATTQAITVAPTPNGNYDYWVRVSNTSGSADSATTTLNVRPGNDDFASAYTVDPAALPYSRTQNNLNGTTESGEPTAVCADPNTGQSLWWNFTPTVSGTYRLETSGSDLNQPVDTMLSVYTGNAVNALAEVACNDDIQLPNRNSRLTLSLTAGVAYRIRLSNIYAGLGGSNPVTLSVIAAPGGVTISANPNTTPLDGQSVVLTANVTTGSGLSYQWYRGAAPSTATPLGTTQQITVTPTPNGNYQYWVRVSNALGSADSTTTTLNVRPGNDDFASAYTVDPAALPYTRTQNSTNATNETVEQTSFDCGAPYYYQGSTGSLWWDFTPTASGTYQIDTIGSQAPANNTRLSVWIGNVVNGLSLIGCDDNSGGNSILRSR
ncbi:MAG: hypothetical protein U0670_08770 [Anaerolineae bacterium]